MCGANKAPPTCVLKTNRIHLYPYTYKDLTKTFRLTLKKVTQPRFFRFFIIMSLYSRTYIHTKSNGTVEMAVGWTAKCNRPGSKPSHPFHNLFLRENPKIIFTQIWKSNRYSSFSLLSWTRKTTRKQNIHLMDCEVKQCLFFQHAHTYFFQNMQKTWHVWQGIATTKQTSKTSASHNVLHLVVPV